MSANKTTNPTWHPLIHPYIEKLKNIDSRVLISQSPDKDPGMGLTASLSGIIDGKRRTIGVDLWVVSGDSPELKSGYNSPHEGYLNKTPEECIREFDLDSRLAFDEHEAPKYD